MPRLKMVSTCGSSALAEPAELGFQRPRESSRLSARGPGRLEVVAGLLGGGARREDRGDGLYAAAPSPARPDADGDQDGGQDHPGGDGGAHPPAGDPAGPGQAAEPGPGFRRVLPGFLRRVALASRSALVRAAPPGPASSVARRRRGSCRPWPGQFAPAEPVGGLPLLLGLQRVSAQPGALRGQQRRCRRSCGNHKRACRRPGGGNREVDALPGHRSPALPSAVCVPGTNWYVRYT